MKHITSKTFLAAVLGLVALMAPSASRAAGTLATETDYFHCPSPQTTPVGNLTIITDGSVGSWNTTAPAGSVTAGNGCAYASAGTLIGGGYQTIYDALYHGTFVGNLDSLTVQQYVLLGGAPVTGSQAEVQAHLSVDGVDMFGEDTGCTPPGTPCPKLGTIQVTPVDGGNNLSLVSFTITHIGANKETGTGTEEHDIALTVNVDNYAASLYPLDATEAPSGITFNPATPADASIAATP